MAEISDAPPALVDLYAEATTDEQRHNAEMYLLNIPETVRAQVLYSAASFLAVLMLLDELAEPPAGPGQP